MCANCHGTQDKLGSLPTSLRFAEGKFKNGSDPLSIYRTLTYGFGLMAPQSWMVPSQKYDVIHYLRETYLKPHNPTQYATVDPPYLARLPSGDTRGPEPSKIEPWSAMDYGPTLAHTYEIPGLEHNFAYKGIAVRLDPGGGGVSRGRQWMIFDTDAAKSAQPPGTERAARARTSSTGKGIPVQRHAHGVHPHVVLARSRFANLDWARLGRSADGQFSEDIFATARKQRRDGRRYGSPSPRDWAGTGGCITTERRRCFLTRWERPRCWNRQG